MHAPMRFFTLLLQTLPYHGFAPAANLRMGYNARRYVDGE